eukprot:TRINITY_DN7513_c4_g1_i1.p1 TRINITY_DN7513_c4_g1~~TRINITY_DN7513_c4_g1_i1.p1  ORF type:complete len:237 (-),score=57.88 TRINITY_DN7513_c4_g1_i1:88-798(-)
MGCVKSITSSSANGSYESVCSALPKDVFRVGLLGSTQFHNHESHQLCALIGQKLALHLGGKLVLLTGGNAVVHEAISRPFFEKVGSGLQGCVFHLLPRSHACRFSFGKVLVAGQDMEARRELLARCSDACIAIEGGPGTMEEIQIALSEGKPVLALKRSGGASAQIQNMCQDGLPAPSGVKKELWDMLKLDQGEITLEASADAVVNIIRSLMGLPTEDAQGSGKPVDATGWVTVRI